MLQITLALFATLVALYLAWGYVFMRKNRTYWEKRGVTDCLTWKETWNMWLVMFGKMSVNESMRQIYERSTSACVWTLSGRRYALVLRDPELVGEVLVKQFAAFEDRGLLSADTMSVVDLGLVSLTGTKWKAVRSRVSPAFTTGKLRGMLRGMVECSLNSFGRDLPASTDLDMSRHLARYAVDIIGSIVFGLDSVSVPRFREMSRRMAEPSRSQLFRMMVIALLPKVAKKLDFSFVDREAVQYFEGLVRSAFQSKKVEDGDRNNFVALLMQLKEKGKVELRVRDAEEEDSYLGIGDQATSITETIELTDELLFAQAFQFLTAGLEATSLTMTWLLLELAHNPRVQQTLRTEIEDVLNQNYGILTYDALKNMEYLDMCCLETLRKYPPAGMVSRLCVRSCQLKGGLKMEPDTQIFVPVLGLHRDPEYFPEPDKFLPERFDPRKESGRPKHTFLAFGEGPRMCIGMRFALLEIKVGIVTLVNRYYIEPSPKTRIPVELSSTSFMVSPKEPVFVRLKRVNPSAPVLNTPAEQGDAF